MSAPAAAARTRRSGVPLAPLTTLRLGGPARTLVEAPTAEAIVAAVQAADDARERLLVLGGGSNLVLPDHGVDGVVVHVSSRGVSERPGSEPGSVLLEVEAGEPWEDLVSRTVDRGLAGMECLAGIPGSTGATPVQNVGAYGQEIAQILAAVRVYDRAERAVRTLDAAGCGFGYRSSVFKTTDRYVVLRVTFALERSPLGAPVQYAELARALGVAVGKRAPLAAVQSAVLGLRRGKGMVVDPDDPDTRSAGSFFTNPTLGPAELAALEARVAARLGQDVAVPRYPAAGDAAKVSAAWLIERAGFAKGYTRGRAAISTKHTLALTTREGATSAELVALAREVRNGVREAFGVELHNEPVLLDDTL